MKKQKIEDTDYECLVCDGSLKLKVVKELPKKDFIGEQRYQIVERYHFCGQCGLRYEFPPTKESDKQEGVGFSQSI